MKVNSKEWSKMAWKIYLAEIAEEGIDLVEPNKAHELVERCFELARNFIIVRGRLTAKPPKDDRPKNENRGAAEARDQEEEKYDRAGDKPDADEAKPDAQADDAETESDAGTRTDDEEKEAAPTADASAVSEAPDSEAKDD